MKKIIIVLICIFIFPLQAMAIEENKAAKSKILEGEIIELEPQDDTHILDELQEEPLLQSGIKKYYTFDKGLLKIHINDYINFDFGAIGNMGL